MATTTTEILASQSQSQLQSQSQSQSQIKQPSERLQQAINNCSLGFKKLADSIQEALTIGRSEGFTDMEIGSLIRQEMLRNSFSIRTVQRYLPASAKRLRSQVIGSNNNNNNNSDNLSLQLIPSDYNSENLPKYTKKFLIEIIHYLEQKYMVKTKVIENKNKKKPLDKTQEIIALHRQGKSIRAISAATGVAASTVVRRINSNKSNQII